MRFVLTAGILVTFFVYNGLLAPALLRAGRAGQLLSPASLLAHSVVPLLALADFWLFRYRFVPARHDWLAGCLMPALYLAYALGVSLTGGRFGGRRAPYFFLDYRANGWFRLDGRIGTAYWCLMILAFVLLMSRGMLWVHGRLERRAAPDHKEECSHA